MGGWVVDVEGSQLAEACERLDRTERVLAMLVWAVLLAVPTMVWWVIFG